MCIWESVLTASACRMLNLQTGESVKDQDFILISESEDKHENNYPIIFADIHMQLCSASNCVRHISLQGVTMHWGYRFLWKYVVKLLLDFGGCSGSKILSEDHSSPWKPLHFNPVSPVSEQNDTWWKSLLLFHRDDFLLAPFPAARIFATTMASDCCLSLPASSPSLPGANISLAKDSSSCSAWFWNPWQKVFHIVCTKEFQIPGLPGWFLLFIYLLLFQSQDITQADTVFTILVSLICWALGCSLSSSVHVLGHAVVSECCSAVTRKTSTSGKNEKDVLALHASVQLHP